MFSEIKVLIIHRKQTKNYITLTYCLGLRKCLPGTKKKTISNLIKEKTLKDKNKFREQFFLLG